MFQDYFTDFPYSNSSLEIIMYILTSMYICRPMPISSAIYILCFLHASHEKLEVKMNNTGVRLYKKGEGEYLPYLGSVELAH